MKATFILFLLIAGCDLVASEPSPDRTAEQMVGAMLLTELRGIAELKFPRRVDEEVMLDGVLFKLRASYDRLRYQERCEFAFFTILFGELDAGPSLAFTDLIKRDAPRIRADLAKVPDSVLRDRFGVTDERIKRFRDYLKHLEGVDEHWHM